MPSHSLPARHTFILLVVSLLAWTLAAPCNGFCAGNPATKKPMRVIYVEGGPFLDFQLIFRGIAQGLYDKKLIDNASIPLLRDASSMRSAWKWMQRNAGGKDFEFLKDGFYSANWDASQRSAILEAVRRRIVEKKDVDLILAFGTWAASDIKNLDTQTPVVAVGVSNAVESKIVSSLKDSGKDNLVAVIDPLRFKRQLDFFVRHFNFKKLGIAYEDTPSGRDSISLKEIETFARSNNVELIRCTNMFDIPDTALAAQRLYECHKSLVEKGAEAVFITYNVGMAPEYAYHVLTPLLDAKLPTFSQLGPSEVKMGVLLSTTVSHIYGEGLFAASLIQKIHAGAIPRSLSQVLHNSMNLAVNINTATIIGWNPDLDVLASVDEFY
ncbi:MAG: ABC transporter substrate-binding protein [Desulfovibrio sp.]|nr:ABC transporter substrate-binding protein [Desulfovibrio sp.]